MTSGAGQRKGCPGAIDTPAVRKPRIWHATTPGQVVGLNQSSSPESAGSTTVQQHPSGTVTVAFA